MYFPTAIALQVEHAASPPCFLTSPTFSRLVRPAQPWTYSRHTPQTYGLDRYALTLFPLSQRAKYRSLRTQYMLLSSFIDSKKLATRTRKLLRLPAHSLEVRLHAHEGKLDQRIWPLVVLSRRLKHEAAWDIGIPVWNPPGAASRASALLLVVALSQLRPMLWQPNALIMKYILAALVPCLCYALA